MLFLQLTNESLSTTVVYVHNFRWRAAVDDLPNCVRKAVLNITRPEEITSSDLQLLNTSVIAMFQVFTLF